MAVALWFCSLCGVDAQKESLDSESRPVCNWDGNATCMDGEHTNFRVNETKTPSNTPLHSPIRRPRIDIDYILGQSYRPWPSRPPLADVVEALVEDDEEFEGWLL